MHFTGNDIFSFMDGNLQVYIALLSTPEAACFIIISIDSVCLIRSFIQFHIRVKQVVRPQVNNTIIRRNAKLKF